MQRLQPRFSQLGPELKISDDWRPVNGALLPPGSEASVREESDDDATRSDDGDAETPPTWSPTTPKALKSKNSSGAVHGSEPRRFPVDVRVRLGGAGGRGPVGGPQGRSSSRLPGPLCSPDSRPACAAAGHTWGDQAGTVVPGLLPDARPFRSDGLIEWPGDSQLPIRGRMPRG